MNFDKETVALLLAYFKRNLHSSASRDLRDALADENSELLWRHWTGKIADRVKHLAMDRFEEMLAWGDVPLPPDGMVYETEFSDYRTAIDFLKHTVQIIQTAPDIPPILWLEHIAEAGDIVQAVSEQTHPEVSPLIHQVILGEYRLLLGLLYPELIPFRSFAQSGKRHLVRGMELLVNEKGVPGFNNLAYLRGFLACWTRSLLLATRAGQVLFPTPIMRRFEWVILQTAQWTRSDGSAVFSAIDTNSRSSLPDLLQMLDAALHFDEDLHDWEAISIALAPLVEKKGVLPYFIQRLQNADIDLALLPESTCFIEDLTIAVQRPDWTLTSPALYWAADPTAQYDFSKSEQVAKRVLYKKSAMSEFRLGGKTIWSGNWDFHIQLDGRELRPASSWKLNCCESNEVYSYLEWCMLLTEDYRIERQSVLIPSENILLIADTLRKRIPKPMDETTQSEEAKQILYECSLPISENFEFVRDSSARGSGHVSRLLMEKEIRRSGKTPPCRLIPLIRSEKASEIRCEINKSKDCMTINVQKKGSALYVPILFDLDPVRVKKAPYQIRRLTVAEEKVAVSDDRALGICILLGNEQFVLYRSLDENRIRTVLSLHLSSDFVLAKFDKETGPEPIVEIEIC